MRFVSSPLGPLTRTSSRSAFTSTPLGMATGIFPIRDTAKLLPNLTEDLAAQPRLARLPAAGDPLRCGNDRDSQASEDLRNLLGGLIDAASGSGDPLEAVHDRLSFV